MKKINIPHKDKNALKKLFNLTDHHYNGLIKTLMQHTPNLPIVAILKDTKFDDKEEITKIAIKILRTIVRNKKINQSDITNTFYLAYIDIVDDPIFGKEKFKEKIQQIIEVANQMPIPQQKIVSSHDKTLLAHDVHIKIKPVFDEENIKTGNAINPEMTLSYRENTTKTYKELNLGIDKNDLLKLKKLVNETLSEYLSIEKELKEKGIKQIKVEKMKFGKQNRDQFYELEDKQKEYPLLTEYPTTQVVEDDYNIQSGEPTLTREEKAYSYRPENQGYTTIMKTYAKLLEKTPKTITANVLINQKTRTFQKRVFESIPFKELELKINDIFEMEVLSKTGERKITYKINQDPEITKIFAPKEYFKGLENTNLFKPLPPEDESDL